MTGGAGFIGSHIVDELVKEGYETVVMDNLSTGNPSFLPSQLSFYEADITSESIKKIFEKELPDVVIHQAAQVDVSKSIKQPSFDAHTNIIGTIMLLEACKEYKVKKIVYASSCAVYGETGDVSINECLPVKPISFYGISKYTPEVYLKLFYEQFGLQYTILRYANVYGPRQTPKGEGGVVSIFLEKLKQQESFVIFGDGQQTRDFVYVKDVAEANILALNKGNNETINIGTNTKTSINELYSLLKIITGPLSTPIYLPSRSGDILYSRLDNRKACEVLGWKPRTTLEQGLNKAYQYYFS